MAAVLSAVKPMLLIRPSKALGPDSHLEMDKNIKNNPMIKNKGSISKCIASIAVPTSYLIILNQLKWSCGSVVC